MRELAPQFAASVDPTALIADLALGDQAPAGRPYTVANFVSSLDGRASVDGGSTGLGDDGDTQIFRALRGCADAVLAGTGTLAAEHYGALARDPSIIRLRARLGLAPQPPLVTVSRSGRLPAIPLLDDPGSTVIVYAGGEVEIPDARATVQVVRWAPEAITMTAVLADLRGERGIRLLLCEGGPSIFGDLVAERVCDELFLTLAARLAGGDGGAITSHLTLAPPLDVALRWVLEQDGSLYLRYALSP